MRLKELLVRAAKDVNLAYLAGHPAHRRRAGQAWPSHEVARGGHDVRDTGQRHEGVKRVRGMPLVRHRDPVRVRVRAVQAKAQRARPLAVRVEGTQQHAGIEGRDRQPRAGHRADNPREHGHVAVLVDAQDGHVRVDALHVVGGELAQTWPTHAKAIRAQRIADL